MMVMCVCAVEITISLKPPMSNGIDSVSVAALPAAAVIDVSSAVQEAMASATTRLLAMAAAGKAVVLVPAAAT